MKILGVFLFVLVIGLSCRTEKKEDEAITEIVNVDSLETATKTKPEVISDLEKQLTSQGLLNIQDFSPSIIVDLKYSTEDNFFGSDVYGDFDKAYLQKEVVLSLVKVQNKLQEAYPDYTLYIFDAVRPLSIQRILWNALDSIPPAIRKAYVADPEEGSIHNYGCAIDLSIYDTQKDTLLDMGTNYDHFGELAFPRREQEMLSKGMLTQTQLNNRLILRNAMETEGFMPITSEWWHFNRYSRAKAKELYGIVR